MPVIDTATIRPEQSATLEPHGMTEANRLLSQSSLDADARWDAWVAKGVEHDRVARTRAFGAAVLLGLGLAGWLATAVLR